jgi:hypothetical protein
VSIVNRRNALLGWAVWMAVRQQAKRRARRAIGGDESPWRGRLTALALGAATAVGLVFLWRKLRAGEEGGPEAPTVEGVEPTPLPTVRDDDVPPAA